MTAPSERTLAHPTVTLRCTSCGATYADTEPLWACVCGGLLTVDYQWPAALTTDRAAALERDRQGDWPLALCTFLAAPHYRVTGNAWRGRHAARPLAALGRAPRAAPRVRQAGVRLAHRLVQGPWRCGSGGESCRMGHRPDGRGFLRQRRRLHRRLQRASRHCLRHFCPGSGPRRPKYGPSSVPVRTCGASKALAPMSPRRRSLRPVLARQDPVTTRRTTSTPTSPRG